VEKGIGLEINASGWRQPQAGEILFRPSTLRSAASGCPALRRPARRPTRPASG
jgi:hypothetical protein